MNKIEIYKTLGIYEAKIDDNTHLFDVDKNIAEYIVYLQKENRKCKEVIDKIKSICDKVPCGWSICGIDVVHKIEKVLKEVEHD